MLIQSKRMWIFLLLLSGFLMGCDSGGSSASSNDSSNNANATNPPLSSSNDKDDNVDNLDNSVDSNVALAELSLLGDNEVDTGAQVQYQATAFYVDGSDKPVTELVNWSISPTHLATISDSGLVTTLFPGELTVNAQYSEKGITLTQQSTLTIIPATLVSIAVTPKRFLLGDGVEQRLQAIAQYSDGSTVDITQEADWQASATTLNSDFPLPNAQPISVTVSSNGVVYSDYFTENEDVDNTTRITASFQGLQDSAELVVFDTVIDEIDLFPQDSHLPVGGTQSFSALAWINHAPVIQVVDVTDVPQSKVDLAGHSGWRSSHPEVVQIDRLTGFATVLAESSEVVTITLERDYVEASATISVVDSATLTVDYLTSVQLNTGMSEAVSFMLDYGQADAIDITHQPILTLQSSDQNIVTINEQKQLSGVSAGVAWVYPKLNNLPLSPIQVSVKDNAITALQLTPSSIELAKGTNKYLSVTANFADGSSKDVTEYAQWTTSNSDVVSVTPKGQIIGHSVTTSGNPTNIKAYFLGHGATAEVSVKDIAPESIRFELDKETHHLQVGDTAQATIMATFSDGSQQDITSLASVFFIDTQDITIDKQGKIQVWQNNENFAVAAYAYGYSLGYEGYRNGYMASYDYGYGVSLPSQEQPIGQSDIVFLDP